MDNFKYQILVIDDEKEILELIEAALTSEGHEILTSTNGKEGLWLVHNNKPDIVILDVMMPVMDGREVLNKIRSFTNTPVIMLSARTEMGKKVEFLNSGADDYLTKPFGMAELNARINTILRRTNHNNKPRLINDRLKIDFEKRQVIVDGKEIKLTPTEYKLFNELIENPGKVLTYNHLLNNVWGPAYDHEREYLHVFIGHLRAKIEGDSNNPRIIRTLPGVGYWLEVVEENRT